MLYGGLDEAVWRRMLKDPSLVLRLTALRALAEMGQQGSRALLTGPSFSQPDLGYPWVWAVCQCVDPELFQVIRLCGQPSHDLLSRVRFLLRRRQKKRDWRVRRSRQQCLQAMLEAMHPLQTLACAVRLLEQHGEQAIPAFLEAIRLHPPDGQAECAAWALGQLGRLSLPEIVQEYRNGTQMARRHLAMALWYLGRAADKAVPLLVKDKSRQAHAALIALKERASLAMIEARRGPVWLDEQAVCALARIAFSDADREFAAGCLGGFGPAAERGLPILRHLAADPRPTVRYSVARGLGWGGRGEALPLLFKMQEDKAPEVQQARTSLQTFHQWPEFSRAALLEQALLEDPEQQRRAAGQLAGLGFPPDCEAEINSLLRRSSGLTLSHLLVALAKTQPFPAVNASRLLWHLTAAAPSVRYAAAQAVRRLPASDEVRAAWRSRLWDDDKDVLEEAVQALAELRLGLTELGLTAENIQQMPVGALAMLLAKIPPGLIDCDDLLPLFKRPEAEARQAAATALGLLGPMPKQVLKTLERGLKDPQRAVALACARSLLSLGETRHAWVLLGSPDNDEQSRALEVIRDQPHLLRALVREFRSGLLVSQRVLHLLKDRLPAAEFLDLLEETLPGLNWEKSRLLADGLAGLGLTGLERLPHLLGHPVANVREAALHALEQILTLPLAMVEEWMARTGRVLPLHQQSTLPRLPEIVGSFLQLSQAWADPRLTALLGELARSPHPPVAARAVAALGQAYTARAEPEVAEQMLAALDHPHAEVRGQALRTVSTSLPIGMWKKDPGPFMESRLLHRAADFVHFGLDREQLAEGLLCLDSVEGEVNLFLPSTSQQVSLLVSLLNHPIVSAQAMRLLGSFSGQPDFSSWRAILRAATDPATAAYHGQLVRRWPRLVLSALAYRSDGVTWVVGLGKLAQYGLLAALCHKGPGPRRRALEALRLWPTSTHDFRARLAEMARSDPHPEIRASAANQGNSTVRGGCPDSGADSGPPATE